MAPNKFATMLHRNTHNVVLVLFYAFLEWILIFLLFLSSFFSYLISKFANYFGLKPPCVFCSRVDHILDPNPKTKVSYRELLCETHAVEISKFSYCKNHRKLAESISMCSDCSDQADADSVGIMRRKFDFVSWAGEEKLENRENGFELCSCCETSLTQKPYPGYLLIKSSSWGETLDFKENGGLILEMIDEDKIGDGFEKKMESDQLDFQNEEQNETGRSKDEVQQQNGEVLSDIESYGLSLREVSEEEGSRSNSTNFIGNEEEMTEIHGFANHLGFRKEDDSFLIFDLNGNQFVACDRDRLIPVELIDSSTIKNQDLRDLKEEDPLKQSIGLTEDDPPNDIPVAENLTEVEQFEEEREICNEPVEEKLPETPTSLQNLHYLHKKLLAMEESMDGSSVSEMDGGDPSLTIERLRAAVKAEREALRALYAELEEERSASAIAANQTMAMITRLQEEKAKMQMEALQYQRMMEEQSEYDQEALQLLNDLMVKREKEKEELEKEVEVYRKKVLEYEASDKTRTLMNIDIDGETENEESGNCDNDDSLDTVVNLDEITSDCVKHMNMLDESLSEFEEERLAIVNQLKALEEKLLTLEDDELVENVKSLVGFSQNYENVIEEQNEYSTGFPERPTMSSMAKSLLPLLDDAENEAEGESEFVERQNHLGSNLDLDEKKLEIIEQVDSVYERLQALETDGEFLKHCMGSIKNGDRGTDLLQEILQHLRDLRAIELRESSTS